MRPTPASSPLRAIALPLVVIALALAPATAARAAGDARPLTLHAAYKLALGSNPTIELLDQRVRAVEAARRAAWVALKPTAGVQLAYTYYNQRIALDPADFIPAGLVPPANLPGEIVIQQRNQLSLSAQVNVPLFRGAAYQGIGAARRQVAAARLRRVRSRRDFLLQIARAYYGTLSAREVVRALDGKVKLDERNMRAAKARRSVGAAPRSDVMRADLVLTQDRQALRRARIEERAAQRQLAILVGVPGRVAPAAPASQPASQPAAAAAPAVSLSRALERRNDYRASAVAVEAARSQRRAVWWSFAPNLDLTWSYRFSQVAGFAPSRGAWNLVLALTLPLYDGGERYAKLSQTEARVASERAQRRVLRQNIEQQLVTLRAEVVAAHSGVLAAHKALALATTTASDMSERYAAGSATQLDVLDASQRRLQADLDLTRSRYRLEVARLALAHAAGRFRPLSASR
ncbi:MAG: TolC family protein [Myxococcales bacterium]|nr:TolC family protein [Myxococcales bacterium]